MCTPIVLLYALSGRIEIGHVAFGAPMQRSPKSTEAVYLLAREAFALGNRRLEWKCNNDPMEATYVGIHMWAQAAEKAKSTDVDKVREALAATPFRQCLGRRRRA